MLSLAAAAPRSACGVGPVRQAKATVSLVPFAILLLSVLATSVAAHSFPYVPTTILLPELTAAEDNGSDVDVAYIFRPDDDGSAVQLLSLNISSTVDGDKGLDTISANLPFLDGVPDTTAFLPTIADNGTIIVQAGDCSSADGYQIWTYTPSNLTSSSNDDQGGRWRNYSAPISADDAQQAAPFFLAAGISFSTTLAPDMSEPVLYSYGGMCTGLEPVSDDDESAWQSNATYSKQMVKIGRGDDGDSYTASFPSGKGPAFAEAGFSFTPLVPSVSNRSGAVTQQRSYVMLGGHTEEAFINMSTAAIWNLPEESWSFVSINQSGDGGDHGIELAVKDVNKRSDSGDSVDSRSGHTAVLNEDGDAIIVMGGWVGAVSRAAEPQLAVLRMGDSFSDWSWDIPDDQPEDSGVFGHGAALLPGNVMMIYGGYEISEAGSKAKRQDGGGSPQFLNLTSMSWGSSYSNPSYSPSSSSGDNNESNDGDDSSSSSEDTGSSRSEYLKRVAIGVGVGVGTSVVIGALLAWFCYKRRQNQKKRDDAVRDLQQDASRFLHDDDNIMIERDDDPWAAGPWYTGGHDPYDTGVRSLGYQSLRDSRGSLGGFGAGENPPGLMIPRKPLLSRAARGAYQPAASHPGNLQIAGDIHPIYEADEEDPDDLRVAGVDGRDRDLGPGTPTSVAHSDPFLTPTTGAAAADSSFAAQDHANRNLSPSPDRDRRVDPEVQGWQADVDAAEALLSHGPRSKSRQSAATVTAAGVTAGRVSPTRRASMRSARSNTPGAIADDERTASGVSDSNRSALSARSASGVGFRGASAAVNADGRLDTSGSGSSSSNNTFSTAKSTFPSLQAEGPSLLHRGERGGGSGQAQGRGHSRRPSYPPNEEDGENDTLVPGSPSKNKPRRQVGWLGSIRRVFSAGGGRGRGGPGAGYSDSGSSTRSMSPGMRRSSLDGSGEEMVMPAGIFESASRLGALSGVGGAELLRRKQGKRGWDDGAGDKPVRDLIAKRHSAREEQGVDGAGAGAVVVGARKQDADGTSVGGSSGGDEDWDIEKAIEKRLVQVMFTVPKERLRVVNADGEDELEHQEKEAVLVDPAKEAETDDADTDTEDEDEDEKTGMMAADKEYEARGGPGRRRPGFVEDEEKRAMLEHDAPSPEPLRIHKKRSADSASSSLQGVTLDTEPGTAYQHDHVGGPIPHITPPPPAAAATSSPTIMTATPTTRPSVPVIGPVPVPTPPPSTSPRQKDGDVDPWAPARGRGGLGLPATGATMSGAKGVSNRDDNRLSLSPSPGPGPNPGPSPVAESFLSDVGNASVISEPTPSLTLRTAEAVRFEKPRTRVLEMAESYEKRSRESSPTKSVKSLERD